MRAISWRILIWSLVIRLASSCALLRHSAISASLLKIYTEGYGSIFTFNLIVRKMWEKPTVCNRFHYPYDYFVKVQIDPKVVYIQLPAFV